MGAGLTTLQLYRLNLACVPIAAAFDSCPYQVGSSLDKADFRDVDVRTILDDEHFDRLFPDHVGNQSASNTGDALWSTVCAALGLWLSTHSGLNVDYQIQRQSAANAKYSGSRNPLGFTPRNYAAGGDATFGTAPKEPTK